MDRSKSFQTIALSALIIYLCCVSVFSLKSTEIFSFKVIILVLFGILLLLCLLLIYENFSKKTRIFKTIIRPNIKKVIKTDDLTYVSKSTSKELSHQDFINKDKMEEVKEKSEKKSSNKDSRGNFKAPNLFSSEKIF